jgi:rubrerythrin
MTPEPVSPALYVQLTQALVAHELVHSFGLSERKTAELLGLVPSAVSQYLSGKRLGIPLMAISASDRPRRVARGVAQELLATDHPRELSAGLILEAARAIAGALPAQPRREVAGGREIAPRPMNRAIAEFLNHRIASEHAAVADCMRLAQKARDELTRAIFRQIASDSLRHAEIVASLASYLDRGLHATVATGVTRSDIERMIRKELEAESRTVPGLSDELGGVMGLLWQSMESDERKHEVLLRHLLAPGFLPGREASVPGRPRAGARRRSTLVQGRIRSSER